MSKLDIRPYPDLIPDDIINRARQYKSNFLCDGMIGLGVPHNGGMDAGMHPLTPSMRIVGTAMTVHTSDGDNMPIHLALYTCTHPGYVMVIDGGGYTESPYFGDVRIAIAKAVGMTAVIVDGYCRDYDDVTKVGLPVFAKGWMPRSTYDRDPGIVNGPIVCAGVEVNPGDLVVGDSDGVVVVPRRHIDAVLEGAAKAVAYEEERRLTIAAYEKAKREGDPLPEIATTQARELLGR